MVTALWIIGSLFAAAVLWVAGSWVWAHRKVARYKRMLSEITPEKVAERAKKYQYDYLYESDKGEAPLIKAYDEILAEKKKEHGFE